MVKDTKLLVMVFAMGCGLFCTEKTSSNRPDDLKDTIEKGKSISAEEENVAKDEEAEAIAKAKEAEEIAKAKEAEEIRKAKIDEIKEKLKPYKPDLTSVNVDKIAEDYVDTRTFEPYSYKSSWLKRTFWVAIYNGIIRDDFGAKEEADQYAKDGTTLSFGKYKATSPITKKTYNFSNEEAAKQYAKEGKFEPYQYTSVLRFTYWCAIYAGIIRDSFNNKEDAEFYQNHGVERLSSGKRRAIYKNNAFDFPSTEEQAAIDYAEKGTFEPY